MTIPIGTRIRNVTTHPTFRQNVGKFGYITKSGHGYNYVAYDDGCTGIGDDSDYQVVEKSEASKTHWFLPKASGKQRAMYEYMANVKPGDVIQYGADWGYIKEREFMKNRWSILSNGFATTKELPKKNKTIMERVTTMFKNLIDPDTQALVEAGFLDTQLELTSRGAEELRAIQFAEHKAALVAVAKAKLAEEKK